VRGTYQSSGSQPRGALWGRWGFLTTDKRVLPMKMKKKVKLAWLRKQNWLRCDIETGSQVGESQGMLCPRVDMYRLMSAGEMQFC